jgi:hypothetical protein
MISTILHNHLSRYPEMQLEDVYKLLHQGVMGSEHAVTSAEAARAWLARELDEMGAGPAEPVMEAISPEGEMLRVHLRPYIAQGGEAEALLAAFVRTANETRGQARELLAAWEEASRMGVFPAEAMAGFIQEMQAHNFPAVHHSEVYTRLYRPAYRVVRKSVLK